METPQMVVFLLLKGTQYARPKKWRYAVRNAKIEQYAVRKGGGGCHPHTFQYISECAIKHRENENVTLFYMLELHL